MTEPTREHCNLCHRDVYVCTRCGKPSCIGGRTSCPGCELARALDDAQAQSKATGSVAS